MDNRTASFSGEIIARLLGITPRRLQQLAKEGIVPKAGRGQYPLAGVIRAYIQYIQNGQTAPEDIDPDRMEPFKRRAFYQGEREKIALREQAGELVPRLELEAELAFVIKTCVHAFETLPDTLERDAALTPQQAEAVETLCDQLRTSLHERLSGPRSTGEEGARSA